MMQSGGGRESTQHRPEIHDPSRSRAVGLLILLTTILRLLWASALEASNDEAYHFLYTIHPDWSYFDHPPMTAWLLKLGIVLCGGVVNSLSIRLAFVLAFAGSIWILHRWTADWFGERAGFWSAVALNLSGYYTAFGGMFAVPDSPFLFFALFTYWRASRAVLAKQKDNQLREWLLVGIGFGGALLSKYHGVLLPAGVVLFALLTPSYRRLLCSPGPYLAVIVGLSMFSPVVKWNAEHGWASFLFQGGRATSQVTPFLHEGPVKWFFGPMLYLLPWVWFWLVVELVRGLRKFRSRELPVRLLITLTLTPLAFFFVISGLSNSVLLHWPLVGFVPLFPLVGRRWSRLRDEWPRAFTILLTSWILAVFVLAAFILMQASYGVVRFPQKDPTADTSGWASVATHLTTHENEWLNDPNVFLVTNRWYDSGQLAFAVRNRIPTVCYNSLDARGFAFWSKPDDWLGKTAIFVLADPTPDADVIREFGPFFESFEKIDYYPMLRSGNKFRAVSYFRGVNQIKPYPFSYRVVK